MSIEKDGKYNVQCHGAENSAALEALIAEYEAAGHTLATFEEYEEQLKRSADWSKLKPAAEALVGKVSEDEAKSEDVSVETEEEKLPEAGEATT